MAHKLVIVFFVFLTACSGHAEEEKPAGGACSYEDDFFPAIITDIVNKPNGEVDLKFIVLPKTHYTNDSLKADTMFFSLTNRNDRLTAKNLDSLNIHIGDTLAYNRKKMISGSCNPSWQFLELFKYKKE